MYSTVRNCVRERRAQINAEAGWHEDAFVPQLHVLCAEAEVDFDEAKVILDEVETKCHMFAYRRSDSAKAVHRVYSTQGQQGFLESHIDAFETIGGIPTRHIRYDNLCSAVTTVIYGAGRRRTENPRWVLFCPRYGFDTFYRQPGIEVAHQENNVERVVGRFRRTRLTPITGR